MKFKISTLLLLTAVIAVLLGWMSANYNDRMKIVQIGAEIDSPIEELRQAVSDKLKINADRQGLPPLNPYSFPGNSRSASLGSVFGGESHITREVVVENEINVSIEAASGWNHGDPSIVIENKGGATSG